MSEWKSLIRSDSLRPYELYSPWNSSGQNTGVSSLSLLQGIFPTQGSNPDVDFLPAELPGKSKNSGVGSLSLLQRIILTQEMNWGLLHCRLILYQLSYQGSPITHTCRALDVPKWCVILSLVSWLSYFWLKKKSNIPTKSTFEDCERKGNINGKKKNRRKRLKRKINRWFVSLIKWW